MIATGVIRGVPSDRVEPVVFAATNAPVAAVQQRDMQAEEISRLRSQLEQAQLMISGFEEQVAVAATEAEERGRMLGLSEAADLEHDRIGLLRQGMADAVAALEATLKATEQFAILIARECVDSILGEQADRASLVHAVIRRQMEMIAASMIVSIEVAAADFSVDGVNALAAGVASSDVAFVRSADRAPGTCGFMLRTGEIEAGPAIQWPALRGLLTELASGLAS